MVTSSRSLSTLNETSVMKTFRVRSSCNKHYQESQELEGKKRTSSFKEIFLSVKSVLQTRGLHLTTAFIKFISVSSRRTSAIQAFFITQMTSPAALTLPLKYSMEMHFWQARLTAIWIILTTEYRKISFVFWGKFGHLRSLFGVTTWIYHPKCLWVLGKRDRTP